MTEYDLGWLAGLIDAEGCIRAHQNPNSIRGYLTIGMNHVPTLRKAQDVIHAIINRKPKLHQVSTHPQYYNFAVQSKGRLYRLLPPLIPHLTAKRKQSEILLGTLRSNDPAGVDLLRQLKRNPEPSPNWEGVETEPGEASPAEIGWLAGVIDGDGCFCHSGKSCGLFVNNTSTALLFKAAMIIQKVSGIRPPLKRGRLKKPSDRQPYYIYTGRRKALNDIVAALYEHLVEKRVAALSVVFKHRVPKRQSNIKSPQCCTC